jgi:E3 ubiquitin-protein ligase HUWE1
LRLLVLLTRDHHTACHFVKRDGVSLLFSRVKTSSVPGSQSYIAIILRHIVEDQTVVQHIMRQSLRRYFTQGRTRIIDMGTFLKNCSPMALRDPDVFIQVTESLCRLSHPSTPYHVSLKPEATPKEDKTPLAINNDAVGPAMQADQPISKADSSSPSESLESVVHFLISELMQTAKVSHEPMSDSTPADITKAQDNDATVSPPSLVPEATAQTGDQTGPAGGMHDRYVYSCFLMQCLTELLFSYDSCKIAFLSYSPKKRPQTPAKDTKYRSTTLHYLLSELISFGTINSQTSSEARNRVMMANWAMSVVLALCVDSSSTQELKDISSDLISVRKFVLESVNRAIKDLSPSEPVDNRYGRLLALADLCYRLLTVRFNTPTRKQPSDEVPTHIGKVMLEKNFVATLTTALAEVDLNYPNVKGLVASILRPIEHLCVVLSWLTQFG